MINPYYCYAFSFSLALLMYPLGWSALYPKLTISLISVLTLLVLIHIVLGWNFSKAKKVIFEPQLLFKESIHILITCFVYLLWAAEFIYNGGIPVVKIIMKQPYDYTQFGIPSLHVFVVTFSSFYTIFLFHRYLSNQSKITLLLYLLNLAAGLLIYNRGMIIFNMIASVFLWILSMGTFRKRHILAAALACVAFSYAFGVMGSLRVSRLANSSYSNELFLQTGLATPEFRENWVPKEFFWLYIYVTSPIANLQHNVNSFQVPPFSITQLANFFNNEVLMDFISKRVNAISGLEAVKSNTMPSSFNVATVYSSSYSYLGWSGIILMAVLVVVLPLAYRLILPKESPFYLTGIVILATMYLFLAFDNMIKFTGLAFQLVYPALFAFLFQKVGLFRNLSLSK